MWTAINRIKKAQQHGRYKTPRLWAIADGINDDIACKTAKFIIDTAVLYNVDVIVFEHLDVRSKKRGSKKQRLHLWKASYVQDMVMHKAHALGIRVNRICAWNTSRLAFDGTGRVERGKYVQDGEEKYNYSICVFKSGKVYNCDLNAAYNIGARYFVREILKSVPATDRLALEAKAPHGAYYPFSSQEKHFHTIHLNWPYTPYGALMRSLSPSRLRSCRKRLTTLSEDLLARCPRCITGLGPASEFWPYGRTCACRQPKARGSTLTMAACFPRGKHATLVV